MTLTTEKKSASLRIIFAGTPEFANTLLQSLLASDCNVVAVYSQPDKPKGRGRHLASSPVKQTALSNNIPVEQPLNFKSPEAVAHLASYKPDLMIVAAYGLILPINVLETPRLGCINVHASLLPRWRGAAPIQRALIAGDTTTGITLMQMDAGLDTGDILAMEGFEIQHNETAQSLEPRLATLGAKMLTDLLAQLSLNEALKRTPQPDEGVTYAKKISTEEGRINWSRSSIVIEREIRGFDPKPGAYILHKNDRIKCFDAVISVPPHNTDAGTILNWSKAGLEVATEDGAILIQSLQLPGKAQLPVSAIINGHPNYFSVGAVLT